MDAEARRRAEVKWQPSQWDVDNGFREYLADALAQAGVFERLVRAIPDDDDPGFVAFRDSCIKEAEDDR